jgi:diguanylate cyclase (GGDEF)-like protein
MTEQASPQYLTYLAEILRKLTSVNRYEEILHLIVDRIQRLTHCQTCAIVLIDEKTEYLRIDNFYGLSQTFCNHFHRTLTTRAVGELLWTGKSVLIRDPEESSDLTDDLRLEHPFGSCLCLQIAVDNRTLGYLHIDMKEAQSLCDHHQQLFQPFADIAGLALVKAKLFEENLRLERVDRETGLDKYGPFLEKTAESMERARQLREPFAIAILDIDNFKSIVNTYGYDASRSLLKEFGTRIRNRLKPLDSGARYGFDEAILLFPNADLEDAVNLANLIREEISATPLTAQQIATTVSIGVASYPWNGNKTDDIILTAKKALFEAQRRGRNTVSCFSTAWYEADIDHALTTSS